jgi:transposase
MENISVVGIDIAKHKFEVCCGTLRGRVLKRKQLYRSEVLEFVSKLPKCRIYMEACGGASYWGREFMRFGHEVKLIAPQFVKPYVKSNKHDRADAEAIMEAGLRPTMRFVSVKTVEQQDIQAVHRVRRRLLKERTALANEIRGLLAEYGVVFPQGISHVRNHLFERLEQERDKLSAKIKALITELWEEFHGADTRVKELDKQLERVAALHPVCSRLMQREGVGPTIATAVVSYVGDPQQFRRGRDFSAYLGLVPKQHSTGGKAKLGRISKRGDKYIRQLLIHGARSVLLRAKSSRKTDKLTLWLKALWERRGFNRTCVALANKNARVLWALMAHDQEYRKAV